MGSFPLIGLDRDYWNSENERDLVALWPCQLSDPFAKWFAHTVTPLFHNIIGSKFKVRPMESFKEFFLTIAHSILSQRSLETGYVSTMTKACGWLRGLLAPLLRLYSRSVR